MADKFLIMTDGGVIQKSNTTPVVLACAPSGDPRGTQAVDLQCCRAVSSQVASGDYSFIASGCDNTASGEWSHAEGKSNQATANATHAEGAFCVASAYAAHAGGYSSSGRLIGMFTRANGQFSSLGDAQHTATMVRTATVDATPTELTLDGQPASGTDNRFLVAADSTYYATVKVVAREQGGTDSAIFTRYCEISNVSGVVSIVGLVETLGTDKGTNAGVPPLGWAVDVTADAVNLALIVTVTGTVENIRWAALIETVEVTYA